MVSRVKERAPYVLMTVLGLFFVAQYYIPHAAVQRPAGIMLQWRQSLGAAILFTAALSLAWVHIKRVRARERRWRNAAKEISRGPGDPARCLFTYRFVSVRHFRARIL